MTDLDTAADFRAAEAENWAAGYSGGSRRRRQLHPDRLTVAALHSDKTVALAVAGRGHRQQLILWDGVTALRRLERCGCCTPTTAVLWSAKRQQRRWSHGEWAVKILTTEEWRWRCSSERETPRLFEGGRRKRRKFWSFLIVGEEENN